MLPFVFVPGFSKRIQTALQDLVATFIIPLVLIIPGMEDREEVRESEKDRLRKTELK